MGHQVNFYLTSLDTALLEASLRSKSDFLILHSRSVTSVPRVVDTLSFDEHGKPWLFLFLIRPDDIASVIMRHVPAQNYWVVDTVKSPVIEVTRCFFDAKIIRRGRFYYNDSFYNSDGVLLEKSELFRNWAKSNFRIVKGELQKFGLFYIGHDAKIWKESSDRIFE